MVGAIVLIPLYFVKHRIGRFMVALAALLSAVVAVQVSEVYLYPAFLGWQFEREISEQPLFRLIAKQHPAEYKKFLEKSKLSIRENKDNADEMTALSAELVNQIFYQHLRDAPDDNILLYLQATLNLYQYLYTVNPAAVVSFETGMGDPNSIGALMHDSKFSVLLNHLLDTKRLLIDAAIKTPQQVPSESLAMPLLQGVLEKLADKYGEDGVRLMFSRNASASPLVVAKLFIEFYSGILGTGKEQAGIILRHIGDLKVKSMAAPANEVPPAKAPEKPIIMKPAENPEKAKEAPAQTEGANKTQEGTIKK